MSAVVLSSVIDLSNLGLQMLNRNSALQTGAEECERLGIFQAGRVYKKTLVDEFHFGKCFCILTILGTKSQANFD